MGDHVLVIGGGVIGAACAHDLAEAGRRVTVLDRGRFTYVCTVPGHAAAGMKGTLTVR